MLPIIVGQEWVRSLKALTVTKRLTYHEESDNLTFPGAKGYDSSDEDCLCASRSRCAPNGAGLA